MRPASNHDPAAEFVEAAVARHQGALLRYAAKLLGDQHRARDVVQDTFMRFMAQRGEAVAGHEAEWLFTVCRHRALDILRKERRMTAFEDRQIERVTSSEVRPGVELERAETHERILQLVERLPPNLQEVVRLKFQNGFSYKEISRITEHSVTNVGFLLHTAVQRLRREFAALQP